MAPVHSQLARLIKEERLVLLILLIAKKRKSKSKRRHRFWIHPIVRQRRSYGAFFHLVRELQMDGENKQNILARKTVPRSPFFAARQPCGMRKNRSSVRFLICRNGTANSPDLSRCRNVLMD
ncbi:hypothetical protein BaRGS_00021562 [Batillaria attramentaria]|uniref:Ribosomal protein S14 n=1 Tax=Batillaria attramentaria TaxID=370345 RepID=A0ABD0KKA5_9CAEN